MPVITLEFYILAQGTQPNCSSSTSGYFANHMLIDKYALRWAENTNSKKRL